MKINYEGEDLNLTKNDILLITDQVGRYWRQDPFRNAKRLISLQLFKTLILMQPAKDVEDIWGIMLKFIDELRYQNYIAGIKNKKESVLAQVKKSISAEIFG